ncbi:MAG: hypothetical protein IH788_05160, partial [Nitrospinae bacterium]|nr:hypothetical protein [Nitrospinota bacterium]
MQRRDTLGNHSSARRASFLAWRGDERGAVAVLVAVLLAVLIGFAGLVIDLGHLFVVRSTLHNAADAASLAAVSSLTYGPDEVRKQAQLLAQQHNVGGTPVALVLADI